LTVFDSSNASPPEGRAEIAAAVAAIRAGHRDAYRIVVKQLEKRLARFARALVGDDATADELTHEAFIRAYLRLDRYDDSRPFFPWLAKLTFRLAQNGWAARQRVPAASLSPAALPADAGDPSLPIENQQRGQRLWKAIDGLSRAERAAVILYYREETSLDETARILGVSPGTVKTLLFRARARLRKHFEE
jgi:RNA polymerase sigma factor (sigma-70 family)